MKDVTKIALIDYVEYLMACEGFDAIHVTSVIPSKPVGSKWSQFVDIPENMLPSWITYDGSWFRKKP